MRNLAINGGKPIRKKLFPGYNPIGVPERRAADRVLKSGILSRYLGCWDDNFYGGPEVKKFEKEWAKYFKVKHAIVVNSCTSGLIAAMGAIGISAGDEVIVSPYSMSISATAPLFYGAVPVFADIEEEYFCLDPKSIEKKITKRTKAIIVVDIFGQPHDADAINKIARKHNLAVVEDCAQAPGAKYKGRYAGTLADIGVFSLNYHKHIHTGEGGVIVTNNGALAERLQLIRNHAESVVGDKGVKNLTNMVGFNFRMTEIQAAIGREQLKRLSGLVEGRIKNCKYLTRELSKIPGIHPAKTRPHSSHVYYMQPFLYDEKIVGIPRNKFIDAVKAELPLIRFRETEGVQLGAGYVKPLYLLPLFQQRTAFGKMGFPFSRKFYSGSTSYKKGICPIVEKMHEKEFFANEYMAPSAGKKDLDDIIKAFHKVYKFRNELK